MNNIAIWSWLSALGLFFTGILAFYSPLGSSGMFGPVALVIPWLFAFLAAVFGVIVQVFAWVRG